MLSEESLREMLREIAALYAGAGIRSKSQLNTPSVANDGVDIS
jgi:hypothetical protein